MSSENAEIRRQAHNVLFERDIAIKDLEQRDVTISHLKRSIPFYHYHYHHYNHHHFRHIQKLQSELSNELGSRALLNQVKQCIAKYPEILELLFDKRIDDGNLLDISHDLSGNVSLGLAKSSSEIDDKNLLDCISSILSFASHYSKQVLLSSSSSSSSSYLYRT
jgi:hypothetical protein